MKWLLTRVGLILLILFGLAIAIILSLASCSRKVRVNLEKSESVSRVESSVKLDSLSSLSRSDSARVRRVVLDWDSLSIDAEGENVRVERDGTVIGARKVAVRRKVQKRVESDSAGRRSEAQRVEVKRETRQNSEQRITQKLKQKESQTKSYWQLLWGIPIAAACYWIWRRVG